MSSRELARSLVEMLDMMSGKAAAEELGIDLSIDSAATYEDVGMLSGNAGLVLALEDGSEYQLTIVRSKRAGEDDD